MRWTTVGHVQQPGHAGEREKRLLSCPDRPAGNYAQEKAGVQTVCLAQGASLADISHEVRTSLNAINGFSEIMAKEIFGPVNNEALSGIYQRYSYIWSILT